MLEWLLEGLSTCPGCSKFARVCSTAGSSTKRAIASAWRMKRDALVSLFLADRNILDILVLVYYVGGFVSWDTWIGNLLVFLV